MKNSVTNLPDYATLKKLATALWQQDIAFHGAAIMVGAGFSRSAASTGDANSKLPLWSDLSKTLAEELGASSSTDPLRLAEEYCAFFGKQSLHDLVKKEISDAAWTPGKLHKLLLELPWSEVLTTNWDTLLERASIEVHHPVYNVVSRQEDLSSARSPRIVKLHGTVNVTEDLVFTQEDYRKYPQRHAAFVNFARQVFIENELCLLGFSGDDPNFLQWTGWVRDHLATHARRIYLVGALNLTTAKRKYLESINVAPIDLGSLIADYDDRDAMHLAAMEIFIEALQSLKPKQAWEWSPTQLHRSMLTAEEIDRTTLNPGYAARLLERHLPTLGSDRAAYPGWLVCPSQQRWALQTQINDPFPTARNLSEMGSDSRAKLLYEIAWRHEVTYEAIPSWLTKELLTICDPAKPCVLTKKQQMEVALLLLKNTRWFVDSESRAIEKITTEILEREEKHWPESANEIAFHQAILMRDRFDYPALEIIVERIIAKSPMWKLRKASLLAELGRFDEGEGLISEAYRELLSQYRNDKSSIYVFSRLAWAHWLLRGTESRKRDTSYEAFPSIYQDQKCSPWTHIEHMQGRISKAVESQYEKQKIEPSFEPGHYKDNSNTITFSSELHPLLLLEGVSSTVGMPLRWNKVGFIVEVASRLAELDEIDALHRFSLAIRAANSDSCGVLKKVFSRTQVACLKKNESDYLLDHCVHAVDYWSSRCSNGPEEIRGYAIDRLRVFLEVLARISVRATPEQAKQLFRLACKISSNSDFHHIWLFDALKHLTEYSLRSTPENEQHELLRDALLIPLQREIRLENQLGWPNPVIKFPGDRGLDAILDRRIGEIIDQIAPCSPQSAPALLRLLPLFEKRFLTDAECQRISEKIWGITPDYKVLPETGLLKHVLINLPTQNHSAVQGLVRRYLFEAKDDDLFSLSLLKDIAYAAHPKNFLELPSEDQAIDYFGRLVAWRDGEVESDLIGFSEKTEKITSKFIGMVLSQSVAPAMPPESLTEENFQKLYDFYTGVDSPETIIAFPYFAATNDIFVERVERLIRQGLQDQDENKIAYSSYALLKWRELDESLSINRLILRLIYLIGSNRMIGLPALLWTVNQMYKRNYLSNGEAESLMEILPVIFDNLEYGSISPSSHESVSASLVRAACVRLAKDITSKGHSENRELLRLIEEAREDALPEVRFAESTDI